MQRLLSSGILLFYTFGTVMLVCGNFMVLNHRSINNIAFLIYGIGYAMHTLHLQKLPSPALSVKQYLPFVGILLFYLLGIWFHNETNETASYIFRNKVNILALSAIAIIGPKQLKWYYLAVCYTFILCCLGIDLYTFLGYYKLIVIDQGHGLHPTWHALIDMLYDKIIPFELFHHTLGVFNAFAFALILVLHFENVCLSKSAFERYFHLLIALLIFAFIHFLSARIGLLLSYLSLCMALYWYRSKLSNQTRFLLIGILLLGFLVCFFAIPTLHTKVLLTIQELQYMLGFENTTHSTTGVYRIHYQSKALEIAQLNWLYGIGFENFSILNINPHNMYLLYVIATGLPLTLLFVVSLYAPFFQMSGKWTYPVVMLLISILIYTSTDNGLDIAPFYVFYCFWVPFMIHFSKVWLR